MASAQCSIWKKAHGRGACGPGDECDATRITEALSTHTGPRTTVEVAGAGLYLDASLLLHSAGSPAAMSNSTASMYPGSAAPALRSGQSNIHSRYVQTALLDLETNRNIHDSNLGDPCCLVSAQEWEAWLACPFYFPFPHGLNNPQLRR